MARTGILLGRFRGIELLLDRSWFIAFVLISWLLAVSQFPAGYPHWSPFAYWWIALMASALFFGSVLAHELGHALVARWLGIPVRDITLFIFGGAARLGREPRRAREEFLIVLAGPAVSLLLALGCSGLWRLGNTIPEPYVALFGWLAMANAILAGFNLLPGFPMDGGRIVRALLWGLTGRRRRATEIAATMGRVVAYAVMAWGLLELLSGNWLGGLWLGLIGAFLNGSAGQAYHQAALIDVPSGLIMRDVMAELAAVHPWATLDVVVEQALLPKGRRCIPVVEGREWRGLLSLASILTVPRHTWPTTRAMQVMQEPAQVLAAGPDDPLAPVVEQMAGEGIGCGVVLDGGELVGVFDLETILARLRSWDGTPAVHARIA